MNDYFETKKVNDYFLEITKRSGFQPLPVDRMVGPVTHLTVRYTGRLGRAVQRQHGPGRMALG